MKQRVRLLSMVVGATISLLTIAGALIVVGIFNESLNWDIFGPKLEAVLYGLFGSSIALACVGVAMTVVLGTQEIVKAFRSLRQAEDTGATDQAEVSKGTYAKYMLYVVLFLAALVTLLALVNFGVQRHRSRVFKRLAAEQVEGFDSRMEGLLAPLEAPPRDHVAYELYDLVRTLDNLSFVRTATLYLPDPGDKGAMWGYTAYREYRAEDGFARFFVAKDFEKAMAAAVEGQGEALTELNGTVGFTWYHVVKDAAGKPLGVLRIDGNPRENFRDYFLGS